MEQVQTASLRLADRTATQVETLWAQHEADRLTETQFLAMASELIARANASGVALVDLGLSAEITRQLRRVHRALGLTPEPQQIDRARISDTLSDVLATEGPGRLGFTAASEVLLTVSTTVQLGMAERGATGWKRQTDANPCQVCVRLADGTIRSIATPMRRHNKCGCIQQPVFRPPKDAGPTKVTPEDRIAIWQQVKAQTPDFNERMALMGQALK